jgi:peptidyl-tRNA hydrolase
MKMWISHPDCEIIVKQCWNTQITRCLMFILTHKLKILKEALKAWNKNTFGNVHTQVASAYKDLDDIQQKIDNSGVSNTLLDQEKAAQIKLEQVLCIEESLWHEKFRVQWHCEGDRNTAFLHSYQNQKCFQPRSYYENC